MKNCYVYILANKRNGTLYVGVTDNLQRRVYQHKEKLVDGFSKKYGTDMLVWYEMCDDAESANIRKKRIKNWNRAWKIEMIEKMNPYWKDLYEELFE